MGRKTSIDELPEDFRTWLNKALVDQNFTGYQALEAALRENGFAISKSSIHRYGQRIERRMEAIKASTEAAKLITEAAGDDQDNRSEAVIALVQTEMFESIISIQEASNEELPPEDRLALMSKAAKNIATLTRASLAQKEFKANVLAKAQAVAEKFEKLAKTSAMPAQARDEIMKSILGIAK